MPFMNAALESFVSPFFSLSLFVTVFYLSFKVVQPAAELTISVMYYTYCLHFFNVKV